MEEKLHVEYERRESKFLRHSTQYKHALSLAIYIQKMNFPYRNSREEEATPALRDAMLSSLDTMVGRVLKAIQVPKESVLVLAVCTVTVCTLYWQCKTVRLCCTVNGQQEC
jgi:hypothetical protein